MGGLTVFPAKERRGEAVEERVSPTPSCVRNVEKK